MTQPHTTTRWITHLERAAAELRADPTPARAYQAMALARHTAAGVNNLETPASALDWTQLVEALAEARDHLTAADPAAAHATSDSTTGTPPEDALADVAQLRHAVADLITETAAALRQIAAATDDTDAALATAVAALTLRRVGNWP